MKSLAAAALTLLIATPALAQQAPGTDTTAPSANPQAKLDQHPAQAQNNPPPSSTAQANANANANANRFVINEGSNQFLIGNLWSRNICDASGKSIGDLKDVLVDHDGKIVALVLGVGGFLGLGEKNVAVDYNYIEKNGGITPNRIVLNITEQELRSAPSFNRPANSK